MGVWSAASLHGLTQIRPGGLRLLRRSLFRSREEGRETSKIKGQNPGKFQIPNFWSLNLDVSLDFELLIFEFCPLTFPWILPFGF
jgi:hypothetical protein